MIKRRFEKYWDNAQFIFVLTVLVVASAIIWQISFSVNQVDDPVEVKTAKDLMPDGFTWIEKEDFGYAYPNSWEDAVFNIEPASSAVLETITHPKLAYDPDFELWQVLESSEDYDEGDIYLGLGIARLERDLTIYEAGYADDQCGFSLYVFEIKGNLEQMRLPTFCTPNMEDNTLPEGATEYTEEVFSQEQEILFSITPRS